MQVAIGVTGNASLPIDRYGTALPTTNLIPNQSFLLIDKATAQKHYTTKYTRASILTGDPSASQIKRTAALVDIGFASEADAAATLAAGAGDSIVLRDQNSSMS